MWPLAACLFAFVVGARWAVVDRFGMDLPEWDQWDAEGLNLLAPWYDHGNFLQALFAPHNEHRVVLTKLLNFGLTLANGQWDQRLEAVVNTLLPASLAIGFFFLARRHFTAFRAGLVWPFLAAAFGLPLAWPNVLGGFHSQQFFLIDLAFVTLVLLPFAEAFSWRWWAGVAAAALGIFSMGSGFFAAVIVIALLVMRLSQREITLRAALPSLVVCVLVTTAGWLTRHEVEYHASLKAGTVRDFVVTVLRCLQWPAPLSLWTVLVMWLPWTWLAIRVLVPAGRLSAAAKTSGCILLGFGAWVWLQLLATAYARGAGGPPPALRYFDTLIFGIVTNAFSLIWLATTHRLATRTRYILAVSSIAWIGLLGWGATLELRHNFLTDLPKIKSVHYFAVANVRDYLATGDESYLAHPELPYPSASALIERLQLDSLRAVLPASVRSPLSLAPVPGSTGFVARPALRRENSAPTGLSPGTQPLINRPTWGSFVSSTHSQNTSSLPREFTSTPLRSPLGGWLKIETAGYAGDTGVVLELRDIRTGESLGAIRPEKIPGEAWRSAYVRAPSTSFVVFASAPDAAHWLAFSEPVEFGTGSYWAWRFSKRGLLIAEIALGAGLSLLIFSTWLHRRLEQPEPVRHASYRRPTGNAGRGT